MRRGRAQAREALYLLRDAAHDPQEGDEGHEGLAQLGGIVEQEYERINASGAVLDILEYQIKPASLRRQAI